MIKIKYMLKDTEEERVLSFVTGFSICNGCIAVDYLINKDDYLERKTKVFELKDIIMISGDV